LGSYLKGFASAKPDAYGEQDRRMLRRVAELAAVAVENVLKHEALDGEKQRLQALVDVNRTIASSLEMQSLLPLISECVTRVVPHGFAGVTLFEGDKENMKAYVLSPRQPSSVLESGRSVSLDQTLSARAFLERESKTLTRDDLVNHSSSVASRVLNAGIRTIRCVPLFTSKGALGTLNVGSKKDHAFSHEDEEILNQVAAQLAIALDNARAYREIEILKDRLAQEKLYLEEEIRTELNFEEIIGESAELKRVLSQARTVAPSGSTVLILGETGTGKELIARAIHRMSKRKDANFIKVNCAAIPTGLLESELLGHEKGAFTGAVSKKIGRMELADKGTLFLDEVGDIPVELQPAIARPTGSRVRTAGFQPDGAGGSPLDCRHQPGLIETGQRRRISQRFVLPIERVSNSHTGLTRAAQRHSLAGAPLREETFSTNGQGDRQRFECHDGSAR
jgi:formate hydrogenlyase transcriptional activator